MKLRRLFALALTTATAAALWACASTPAPAAPAPDTSSPATAPMPAASQATGPAVEPAEPVTTFPEAPQEAETSPPPVTTASTANASGPACMVWRPCTCDEGCVLIKEAKSSLKEGMAVTILSGPQKGSPAMLEAVPSTTGGQTLVVTRGIPGQPSACQREVRSPAIGYGCVTSKSNKPIDPHACESGCGK